MAHLVTMIFRVGDVWRVELDTKFLVQDLATSGMTLDGGDGADDFAGGAGNDHFSGGDGNDRALYFDSQGIGVGLVDHSTQSFTTAWVTEGWTQLTALAIFTQAQVMTM